MMLDIKGSSSHLVLNLFYPRLFMTTLNKPFEKLTVSMDTTKDSITIKSNFDNLKMVLKKQSKTAKMTVFMHNKIYVDLSLEYSLGTQTSIESHLTLSQKSIIHQELCAYSPHLCFRNLHHRLQLTPSVHHYEHSITKDDKNVLSIIASFGQKPYTLHFDSPYIVPFYKYITTQTSLVSRYLDPLPVILSPCEIKMKMDSELHLTWNIDMKEGSVDVTPTQSDKYQLEYHSGEGTSKVAELVTVLDHLKLVLSLIHTRGRHYHINL